MSLNIIPAVDRSAEDVLDRCFATGASAGQGDLFFVAAQVNAGRHPKKQERLAHVVSSVVTLERYNLLVTFHPNQAGLAEREVRKRVEDVEGQVEDIERSSIDGVFCVRLGGDAKQIVSALHFEFQETPEMLVHTYHWVPIDVWVEANEDAMMDAVNELAQGIGENDRWMMHVHKRHHPKHSEELTLTLTESISKGKVDLKNPEKIIAVEVLGGMAGLSLLASDQVINVNRLRQEIGLTRIF